MSNIRVVGGLSLALSLSVLASCGGSSSPAQPAPVPTADARPAAHARRPGPSA